MKHKHLNLVLAVVALGLVAALALSQKKPPPERAALTQLAVDAVKHIAIKHPNAAEIDLEKNKGGWVLTAPVTAAADPFEVQSLTGLANTPTQSTIDNVGQLRLADFGLDPPGYSIVLNDTVLDFGNVEPLKYQRYVRVGGGKIALIEDPPSAALDADYSDLVAKSLLPEGADIAKIEVPGLTVMRAASGPGWTSSPDAAAASSDRLQKFVDAWREARASWNSMAPADQKAAAIDAVTVTLKDGTSLRFIIDSREPQLVLERPDLKVAYSFPKTAAEKLLQLPALAAAAGQPGSDTRGKTAP